MRYNESYYDSIRNAKLYAIYDMPHVGMKVKIHYSMSDIEDRRICLACDDKQYGKYMLIKKSWKKPFACRISGFGFEEGGKTIQIVKK